MTDKQLAAKLAEIDEAYYAAEEDPTQAIADLQGLFQTVWQDAEKRRAFAAQAATVAGGAFIPHLFWPELKQFLTDESSREALANLFRALGESNFDETTQQFFRPLGVVYFLNEKEFEVDRLRTRVISKLHPGVQEYIEGLVTFCTRNAKSADAFRKKFALVGDRFPDFELFNQPLAHLEEQLG